MKINDELLKKVVKDALESTRKSGEAGTFFGKLSDEVVDNILDLCINYEQYFVVKVISSYVVENIMLHMNENYFDDDEDVFEYMSLEGDDNASIYPFIAWAIETTVNKYYDLFRDKISDQIPIWMKICDEKNLMYLWEENEDDEIKE